MLNPNIIYRKTEAGTTEVRTRELGLRAELRRLLILVDGNSPVGRLATFVRGSEIDSLIAELETQGLIVNESGATGGTAHPPPPAASPATAAENAIEPTEAQVQAVRQTAIRFLHDVLGPAADEMAVRIERCRDSRELRLAITEIRHSLDRTIGANTGQRFLDDVRRAAEATR